MNVTLITVGRLKEKFFIDAAYEYIKRLNAYCNIEVKPIDAAKLPSNPTDSEIELALKSESEKILKAIPKGATVITMCIEGKQFSSEELSSKLQEFKLNGISNICFIIGGSYGILEEIKAKSTIKMSMSKMTFPHRLFQIMLLEQIYRAFKIEEGSNYHK